MQPSIPARSASTRPSSASAPAVAVVVVAAVAAVASAAAVEAVAIAIAVDATIAMAIAAVVVPVASRRRLRMARTPAVVPRPRGRCCIGRWIVGNNDAARGEQPATMRLATLLSAVMLCACASRGVAPTPSIAPTPSSTMVAAAIPEPPRSGAAWVLRFERDEDRPLLVARGGGGEQRRPLQGPGAPDSAAGTEAWGDSDGVVVTLADVLGDGGQHDQADAPARSVTIEPSEVCPKPWLVDLAAATVRPGLRVRADPATTRVGCGRVSFADFDGEFGPERVIYYGETSFDARVIASQIAVLRTKLEEQFGSHPEGTWVTEVVIAPPQQPMVEPRGAPTPIGLRVVIDGGASWGAPEHLEVGSTLARTWLLGLLARELPHRDRDDVLDLALLDGLARGIAREVTYALGLIDPDQYVEDLDRAEAIIAARPNVSAMTGAIDARDVAAWAAELSLQTAMVAWRLRAQQQSDVIPAQIRFQRRAHEGEPASALSLWRALTADVLGAPPARALTRAAVHPKIPSYDARALGRCAVAGRTRDKSPELGLVMAFTTDAGGRPIPFVAADGAAAQAGVHEGDRLDGVQVTDAQLRFVVTREQETLVLEAAPRWRTAVRPAWQRRARTRDADCYPPP